LRKSPWNSVPAIASASPTTTASITRGSRSWNRITSVEAGTSGRSTSPSFHATSRIVVPGEIPTEPAATATNTEASRRATSTAMTVR